MREVIDPSLGLLVPRGDQRALASVVESLIADPVRCSELGARCRSWVAERFSEDRVVERLRATYAAMSVTAP